MSEPASRLLSLDQFRGYTVLGMFLVNFVGGYTAIPNVLKHHHTYCSYADTIMPQFLFAVGFGMRLSFLRRLERSGPFTTYKHFLGRSLGLILLGVVIYHLTGNYTKWEELTRQNFGHFLLMTIKRHPFEALTHIGVTSLWVLPVIAAPGRIRCLFAVFSGGLHIGISHAGYYQWNLTSPVGIDGGPLGFLTWTIPVIAGSIAHDWVLGPGSNSRSLTAKLLGSGLLLMVLGYALSCLNGWTSPNLGVETRSWLDRTLTTWPFTPIEKPWQLNYWVMSQRAGSITYLVFATGVALVVFEFFRWLCDRLRFRWGYLDLLGRQALAGYIVHGLVDQAVSPFVPKDAPLWWILACFTLYLSLVTLILWYLDRNRILLKL